MFENGALLLSVQSDIVGLHNQSLMGMYIHVKFRPALYYVSSGFFLLMESIGSRLQRFSQLDGIHQQKDAK